MPHSPCRASELGTRHHCCWAPPQHCRRGRAAALKVNNIHRNNSLGNQTLLPAAACSKPPKPESRTSQLLMYPIHAASCWGDQNLRTEYGSKEEAVLEYPNSYFIMVAQNQQGVRLTHPMQWQNMTPRAQDGSALNLICQQHTLAC